jgi:hypothetical protein
MSARPPEGIQIENQLDQVIIDRGAAGLDEKNILIADSFIDDDVSFAVWKPERGAFS